MPILIAVLFAALVPLFTPAVAAAQYFGRNKVQYEDFDFRVMHTEHFDIYYYVGEEEVARDAARMAERWYGRLSTAFQHAFQEAKPVVFYANHPDFQQTNTTGGVLGESVGGFTESLKDRMVEPFGFDYLATDHVIGHELVHGFQYDIAKSRSGPGLAALNRVPGWMVEGLAEWFSVGRLDSNTAMWLRGALVYDDFPTIDDLTTDPDYFPYRFGQAMWAYIAGRYGDRAVPAVFGYATRGGFDQAVRRVLGTTTDTLSVEWQRDVEAAYAALLTDRTHPDSVGRAVITAENDGGRQNLAPAVSRDGSRIAYLSTAGLFSIDLYVADAETGEVLEELTSTATTPHFDALSFMNSAGSFSPDGRSFATVTIDEGDNQIVILDARDGDIEREVMTPGIGAISDPAWSPDGRRIAFAGQVGGITELYTVDVQTGQLSQLTNDRFTQIQPQWSPDGSLIAYVTEDPQETDFQQLVYGNMVIGVIDVASGQTRTLEPFDDRKHISPNFSPDGQSLYFISDPEGFSDVFRLELTSGALFRLTHLKTGVSGLTGMSPALSVAHGTGRVVFSVFRKNQEVNIHAFDAPQAVGEPMPREDPVVAAAAAGILPPIDAAGEGMVARYLDDALTGLPTLAAARSWPDNDYGPNISLDMIGPPSLGVGSSPFGTMVAGGVSAFFSDMLGDHQLAGAVQASGTVKDIGGQAVYQYRENRWNLGAAGGHVPFVFPFRNVQQRSDGLFNYDQQLFRIYIDQAIGLAQYPFSRTRRVEFQGGFTRYAYNIETQRLLLTPDGRVVEQSEPFEAPDCSEVPDEDEDEVICNPDPLNLVQASAAFVGDNSVFGFTSPIDGGRFRFEATPTFGTLQFQQVVADWRRYLFWNPVTLAFRGLHFGRYGQDAEGRLRPEFIGREYFIRGYAIESFDELARDGCVPSDPANQVVGTCEQINNLAGSRIAVANIELRVPFLGVEEFGLIEFPYVPTELSAFVDAGLAWTSTQEPEFEFRRDLLERHPVVSTGFSARMNVLGFMIVEAYYAYPFQRPERGWHWGFQIMPGW
ncbi:MAG: peptidase S9 [Longimicrobiales bacterium]